MKKILIIITTAFVIALLVLAGIFMFNKYQYEHYTSPVLPPTLTVYDLDEDSIKLDEETGIEYVDNMLIVFFKEGTSEADKLRIVDEVSGTVKGQFDVIDQYQIDVGHKTFDELKELSENLMLDPAVVYASYDLVIDSETALQRIPDDPWKKGDTWNTDNPAGGNWGVEAMQAPEAWEYSDKFSKIKIGILDAGFDSGHEDLKGKITFVNDDNKTDDHGTHVAGIIGAAADNAKGITGIVWNCELICCDCFPKSKCSIEKLYAGLAEEVVNGAKVINVSIGGSGNIANNTQRNSPEYIDAHGRLASANISSLLGRTDENGEYYDFIVVQSSGNGAKDGIGVDSINNGFFASIAPYTFNSQYDNITYEYVRDRIIIVGNAQNRGGGQFIQRKSSNGGDGVDICAPGTDIYSTIPSNFFVNFKIKGDYDEMTGTSMAAPMVTGVAALVWSANTKLTGAEVKGIVCSEENTIYNVADNPESPFARGAKRMVNAKLAVEDALGLKVDWKRIYREYLLSNSASIPKATPISSEHWEEAILNKFITEKGKLLDPPIYGDFDNDGFGDVFVTTANGNFTDIWFIKSTGDYQLMKSHTYGYMSDIVQTKDGDFIVWEETAGGSSTRSLIFGCKNGEGFESSVSGTCGGFGMRGHEFAFGSASDFDKLDCDFIGYTDYYKEEGGHIWEPHAYVYNIRKKDFEVK